MRSKIFIKLLLTQLATLASIVLLILFIVNWSFQQGFSRYLQQQELQQVQVVASLFATQYDNQKSWDFMRQNRSNWRFTLEAANIKFAPRPQGSRPPIGDGPERLRGPKPLHNSANRPPPSQPPPSPPPRPGEHFSPGNNPVPQASLAHRLTLFNQQREVIFGASSASDIDDWVEIKDKNNTLGWLGLNTLAIETDQLASSFVNQQRQNYIYITAAVLLLSLLVAAWWGRQFLRPIHHLAQAAKQLTAGFYSARIQIKGHDELASLGNDFNKMAQTLEQNETTRRQWISDISHELRTPIAVLSAELEALQDGIREPTKQRISSLYYEIGSLGKLVEDLHQLSLSDLGSLELIKEEIDLDLLLQNVLNKTAPRMSEKSLTLAYNPTSQQPISIYGDEQRLTQLFSNLLENSLRYTNSGGGATVVLSLQDPFIKIEITDTAPGVPEDSLEKIFDRLYRVDKSRSRLVGGSGLGLSICKNIVAAHQGKISAHNHIGGGLHICILLPNLPIKMT